jgi:hypothetical protein
VNINVFHLATLNEKSAVVESSVDMSTMFVHFFSHFHDGAVWSLFLFIYFAEGPDLQHKVDIPAPLN